jgi:predicted O-linked N-acetylglucosamine transferase (SPINDLY family)
MVSNYHSRKVSDEVLGIWQRVLIDNPSASLIIVTMEKTPEGAQALFQSRFEKFGMPMSRILAAPRLSMLEFMRLALLQIFHWILSPFLAESPHFMRYGWGYPF